MATSVVFRYVDPDRPARKVIYLLVTDWRRTAVPTGHDRLPSLTGRKVFVRALNPDEASSGFDALTGQQPLQERA